jgi:acyl-homoserine lactone acylase PvdQ
MRPRLRNLIIAGGVVLFLAAALGGAWLWVTRQPFPKTRGSITLEGIGVPVEIFRDRYGVPHIYAQTSEDLFFAQGFVHAQDRFWQMEFFLLELQGVDFRIEPWQPADTVCWGKMMSLDLARGRTARDRRAR